MAEPCAKAFGRYLKTLRERRGLALDDVASLSRSYADPVAKSYLSRVENGIFSLALSKMIPLCRIYEIPTEALIERLELDMELEQIAIPDASDRPFEEIIAKWKQAFEQGNLLLALAFAREGVNAAPRSEVASKLSSRDDQVTYSWIALAGAASHLGRYQFALFELERCLAVPGLSPRISAVLQDRLAETCLRLNRLDAARRYADAAIEICSRDGLTDLAGFFLSERARVARRDGDLEGAIELHKKAFDAYRNAGREIECSRSLHALAVAYFYAHRLGAARRALAAADRLATEHMQERIRGVVRILLGEIEEREHRSDLATKHWKEAVAIARVLADKEMMFRASYHLLEQAESRNDPLSVRALRRRLNAIAPWLHHDVPEVLAFREKMG